MKVSEFMLERFVLNELPGEAAARIRAAIEHDAALRERVGVLAERRGADTRWLANRVRERVPEKPRRSRAILTWAVPIAAALLLAAIVARPDDPPAPASHTAERIKGPDASLAIYRQTPNGSEQLDEGAVARQGDVIRIGYKVSDAAFGMIASVDGRGVVTLHHPDAQRSTRLRGGEVVLLDQAYELDDAPNWERFYIITGTTEFDVAPIVDAIARLAAANGAAPLPLPSTLNQATFQLQKESRP